MRWISLALLSLVVLASGCSMGSDYMIPYRSVAPFHPSDPNALLAELTGGLPADVEVRTFVHHDRTNEMRGLVIVKGSRASKAVRDAIRGNPKLHLVGRGPEQVYGEGKSLICLSSQPPFLPNDENEVLAELQRGLPARVKPKIVRSRPKEDGITLWVTVKGNFGKEATKYAIYRNRNLMLLQVENAPLFLFLWPKR